MTSSPSSSNQPTVPPPPIVAQADREDLRMYHQLQYDRIAQHEQQRLSVSSFVVGFSILSFTIGFNDIRQLNLINGLFLPIIISAANYFAAVYAEKARYFVKMHQDRAKEVRAMFAPELNQINSSVGKVDSNTDRLNRTNLQMYMHYLFIVVAIATIVIYILQTLST